ncbi:sensor histidine kinase [Paenibacillus sp. Marseille-Q4541]|uniref:cache domain-containing sensor histidine kinase n=1 Tax=Paenibacillus sp. Marseille-Q4541 TaxID=2831522 RepID=UPI001BA86E0D|nr:sensor histidine kinase [Paenibacillus sp. Marseille-Q4541]
MLKNLSINKKLITISLLFVCLPVLLLGAYWYNASTATIEKSTIASNQRIVTQTNEYLNLYIAGLETSTYPFLSNASIQSLVNSRSLSPYAYLKLSESIEKGMFAQMLYGRDDLVGMSLVAKNGFIVSDYTRATEMLDMGQITHRNRLLLGKMEQMDDFHIEGIRYVGTEPVLTVTRKIPSNQSYLFEGLLVVDLNLSQIAGICKNVSHHELEVWIADATSGHIIYHPDNPRIGTSLTPSLVRDLTFSKTGLLHEYEASHQNILLYEHSPQTDWIVALEQPKNAVVGELLDLRATAIYCFAVIMIVTVFILGGFSLQISRALSLLERFMKRVQTGDFTLPITKMTERHDEIGKLFRSHAHMVDELKRLVDEVQSAKLKEREHELAQKESALQAMQSQINPHFLYNTLEVINSHAIMENNQVISKMTTSLADLFRYNLKNAHQIVTLREEIGHLRAYLDIQSARYRKLTMDIDLDESMLDHVYLVRLTLQPLVENAFIHGYQNHRLPPTYIGLALSHEQGRYILHIKDVGHGMNEAEKNRLNAYFQQEELLHQAIASSGIGLGSVHERIRLSFGDEYGLFIASSDQKGTHLEVRLPNSTLIPFHSKT